MKRTKIVPAEKIVTILCNICELGTSVEKAEYVTISGNWGFFSKKDLEYHEAHVCEECYDSKIAPLFKLAYKKGFMPLNGDLIGEWRI